MAPPSTTPEAPAPEAPAAEAPVAPPSAAPADDMLRAAGLALAERARVVLGPWFEGRVLGALGTAGPVGADLLADARAAAATAAEDAVAGLAALAVADVDTQRTTPLAVLRAATAGLTDVLRRAGGVPPGPGPADDPYRLVPGRWSDVDAELGELALVWGAAKAVAHAGRHRG